MSQIIPDTPPEFPDLPQEPEYPGTPREPEIEPGGEDPVRKNEPPEENPRRAL